MTLHGPASQVAMIRGSESLNVFLQLLIHIPQTEDKVYCDNREQVIINTCHPHLGGICTPTLTLKQSPIIAHSDINTLRCAL